MSVVSVNKGPFTDFIYKVDKISDSVRAWVLLDILQKKQKNRDLTIDCQNRLSMLVGTNTLPYSVTRNRWCSVNELKTAIAFV